MARDSIILVLSPIFVILVHELGHLAAARMYGVQVFCISIGFGPAIFGFTDRFGTRWRLALLPVGGSCRLEEGVPDTRVIAISKKQPHAKGMPLREWARRTAIIYAAGPLSNFVLATAIYFGTFMYFGEANPWSIEVFKTDAALFMLVGGLSMCVGLFNLVPLPPLDGGRLLLIGLEVFRRAPVSEAIQRRLSVIGLGVVLATTVAAI